MKAQLLIIALLLSVSVHGQTYIFTTPPDAVTSKPYKYLAVYRHFDTSMKIRGGAVGTRNEWVNRHELFYDIDGLMSWLNTTRYPGRKDINVEKLVLIYDLSGSKEVKFQIKEEPRIRKKQVIVEEEKWIDRYYEIKP